MDQETRTDWKKYKFILFLIILAGLSISIFISKLSRLLGVVITALGILLLLMVSAREEGLGFGEYLGNLLKVSGQQPETQKEKQEEQGKEDFLATKLISFLTTGSMKPLFPVLGFLFLLAVPVYNLGLKGSMEIGSNDIVMLLVGTILLCYHRIPVEYSREKDFAVIFFTLLFLLVVLPTTYYAMSNDTTEGSWEDENVPNEPIVERLLARPVSKIVTGLGVDSYNYGVVIYYEKQYDYHDDSGAGEYGHVSIALGCTGLYSVAIFLSGFIAFIFVEYSRFDQKVAVLLGLGILSSYIANLLRMSIIVLVGSYYGNDALLWTHQNMGELIFLIWVGIFWGFMYSYLFDEKKVTTGKTQEGEPTPAPGSIQVMDEPGLQVFGLQGLIFTEIDGGAGDDKGGLAVKGTPGSGMAPETKNGTEPGEDKGGLAVKGTPGSGMAPETKNGTEAGEDKGDLAVEGTPGSGTAPETKNGTEAGSRKTEETSTKESGVVKN